VRLVYDGTNFQIGHPIPIPTAELQIKFVGTPTSKTVNNTVDTVNMRLTVTGHAMLTGQCFSLRNTGGALPTASPTLAANTGYYARVIDANTIELYQSAANALAGTSKITLTGGGSGTNTLDYITVKTATGLAVIQNSTAGSLTAGNYYVLFTTAQANANYVVNGAVKFGASGAGILGVANADAGSTSQVQINTMNQAATLTNFAEVHMVITPG